MKYNTSPDALCSISSSLVLNKDLWVWMQFIYTADFHTEKYK